MFDSMQATVDDKDFYEKITHAWKALKSMDTYRLDAADNFSNLQLVSEALHIDQPYLYFFRNI